MKSNPAKAVILLSGGLDSCTTLGVALSEGFDCYTLSFNYGQRMPVELVAAKRVSQSMGAIEHKEIPLDLGTIGGSALTDSRIDVPESPSEGIPVTYVPARNTIFLSIALGWAEVLGASDIFIGVNAVDYSGYPDCRTEYIKAFEHMANLATKRSVEGQAVRIRTPLMEKSKKQIIQLGTQLNVDYSATVSCYQANAQGQACGKCDSCRLRQQGFSEAKVADPTLYTEHFLKNSKANTNS
jgi:7-cyano-7-deazaguanine synthase